MTIMPPFLLPIPQNNKDKITFFSFCQIMVPIDPHYPNDFMWTSFNVSRSIGNMCYFWPSSKHSLSSGKGSLMSSRELVIPTICPYGCHGATLLFTFPGAALGRSWPIKALLPFSTPRPPSFAMIDLGKDLWPKAVQTGVLGPLLEIPTQRSFLYIEAAELSGSSPGVDQEGHKRICSRIHKIHMETK